MIRVSFNELQADVDNFYVSHQDTSPNNWGALSAQVEEIIYQAGWTMDEYLNELLKI